MKKKTAENNKQPEKLVKITSSLSLPQPHIRTQPIENEELGLIIAGQVLDACLENFEEIILNKYIDQEQFSYTTNDTLTLLADLSALAYPQSDPGKNAADTRDFLQSIEPVYKILHHLTLDSSRKRHPSFSNDCQNSRHYS